MGCQKSRRTLFHKPVAGLSGVSMFGYDVFREAGRLGPHAHKGYELVLMVAGRVQWEVEGEKYEVRGGHLWKARPGEKHRGLGEVMHPCEIFWLVVEPGAKGLQMNKKELGNLKAGLDAPGRIVKAPAETERSLRTAMRELGAGRSAAARGLLVYAVALIARAFGEETRSPKRRLPPEIARALDAIDASLSDPPSVPHLASHVGFSPSRLSTLFREHVGMTPADYVMSRRIEVACERLARSDASVTDIALDLGFSSTQHFSDTFKKRTGTTPSNHRDAAIAPRTKRRR